MPYEYALWVGAAATILYVFIGGFPAVSWTDTVQATLMIFALLITPLFVIFALDMGTVMATIEAQNPANFDMFRGLSSSPSSRCWPGARATSASRTHRVRFMAADSIKTIPNARRIGMTSMILTLAGAVAVGFLGIAYFADHPEQAGAVSQNGERVSWAGEDPVQPLVAGIILSGVLAAVMSTLSAQLLVSSSALTQTSTAPCCASTPRRPNWCGSAGMVLLIALIAIGIASNPESKVLGRCPTHGPASVQRSVRWC